MRKKNRVFRLLCRPYKTKVHRAGGPELQLFRTTPCFNKAFTLIELLVVVLIIGILAAVALPQYSVTVQKTRYAALLPIIQSISNAQKVYKMANGHYSKNFAELDIQLPPGATVEKANEMKYQSFRCIWQGSSSYPSSVYCDLTSATYPRLEKYFEKQAAWCWAPSSDTNAQKICKALSGKKTGSSASGGLLLFSLQ